MILAFFVVDSSSANIVHQQSDYHPGIIEHFDI